MSDGQIAALMETLLIASVQNRSDVFHVIDPETQQDIDKTLDYLFEKWDVKVRAQ